MTKDEIFATLMSTKSSGGVPVSIIPFIKTVREVAQANGGDCGLKQAKDIVDNAGLHYALNMVYAALHKIADELSSMQDQDHDFLLLKQAIDGYNSMHPDKKLHIARA